MSVSIINYHYVRPPQDGMYVITPEDFRNQIKQLKNDAFPISGQDFINSVINKTPILEKMFLLTFDDGYMDHVTNVFPILMEEDISGCFFVPAKPILEKKLLQANKIHLILAASGHKTDIVAEIKKRDTDFGANVLRWYKPGRFDGPQINFIKKMLQRGLPRTVRNELVQSLWDKYVGLDEAEISEKMYMQAGHLRTLTDNGMTVGLHGYEHDWYEGMSPTELFDDVSKSLDLLFSAFVPTYKWIMSYPYGDYNDSLLSILRNFNCSAAFTTQTVDANPATDNPLLIPRFDVKNVFP
jgi:peptidoglycan/xylan/chitin deacetylase (PgdA/CDA1 family)